MSSLFSDWMQHSWLKAAADALGFSQSAAPSEPSRVWAARPLENREIVYFSGSSEAAALESALAPALAKAGAKVRLVGFNTIPEAFEAASEAFSRPVLLHKGDVRSDFSIDAICVNAQCVETFEDFEKLKSQIQPWLPRLKPFARLIFLLRGAFEISSPLGAAVQAAICAYFSHSQHSSNSHAKSESPVLTAHTIRVNAGTESQLPGLIRFLLSEQAASLPSETWTLQLQPTPPLAPAPLPPRPSRVMILGATSELGEEVARILAANRSELISVEHPEFSSKNAKLARELGATPLSILPGNFEEFLKQIQEFAPIEAVLHLENPTSSERSNDFSEMAKLDQALLQSPAISKEARFVYREVTSPARRATEAYLQAAATQAPTCAFNAVACPETNSERNDEQKRILRNAAELCAFLASNASSGLQAQRFCAHLAALEP